MPVRPRWGTKGSRKNNFPEFAPRFKSDWVDLRELSRRRSKAHLEDFASKDRPKMGCKNGKVFLREP